MSLQNIIGHYMILVFIVVTADVGDRCVPSKDIADGICTLITDCEAAIRSINKKEFHRFRRCGFEDFVEIVCCPRLEEKFDNSRGSPADHDNTNNEEKNKVGDRQRTADRECQKIINSSLPPLGLYIIGGEEASLGEFPHMVALGFDGTDGGYVFNCGGSLISATYVLTAAHCVDNIERKVPKIARTGVVDLGDGNWNDETDVRIAEIIRHPNYTRAEKYHDLTLLRLERPVVYNSNLHPICLYTNSVDPKVELTITGWGTTSIKKFATSNILLKANVTVVSREKCGESYSNFRKLPRGISSEQLCAGDPQGLKDTCQGDSGGPLQGLTASDGQYRLVGVTSFGRGCGSPIPGVYTRIFHYLDWIENIVWPN